MMAAAAIPETDTTLTDCVKKLAELVSDPESDLPEEKLPGLDKLINDWYDDEVTIDQEQFARRILSVFKNSTLNEIYERELNKLLPEHKEAIKAFVAGERDATSLGKVLAPTVPLIEDVQVGEMASMESNALTVASVSHQTMMSSPMKLLPRAIVSKKPGRNLILAKKEDFEFQNWGRTVKYTPMITYYPENVEEVKTIVRDSVQNQRGVRVSGFRHSWAPLFGRNNQPGQKNNGDVLISTLSERNAGILPNFTSLPPSLGQPPETELNHIQVVNASYVSGPQLTGGKKYVRVGTATTNEQFRRWCINIGNVTLPMNIIEVEITMGGSNAPICHGAGIKNPTLSDQVRRIEYVDVNAELRAVDMADSTLLNAASGCFGLLGVVTHIVLECDPMCTAIMRPVKLPVIRAIPPPPEMKDADIPLPLRSAKPLTEEDRKKDQQEFERRANNDYYAEWFWFPYSSEVWVNTWNIDTNINNVENYPDYFHTTLQVLGTIIANMAQWFLQDIKATNLFAKDQAAAFSWIAMKNLEVVDERRKEIRTLLPNALHFQRGVQNIRVRDMEVELPLQQKKGANGERDYSNVQRAWWDAIITCYANVSTAPMRMPLEMRIMGSSNVTMAPQRGHTLGTCSIEVLTLAAVADIWEPFAQQVLDKWMRYKDADGKPLRIRPHWAKEWDPYEVNGKPWRETLKNDSYKSEIAEFKQLLAAVGKKHQWTLGDLKRTFSNETLDYFYLDDVQSSPHPGMNGGKTMNGG